MKLVSTILHGFRKKLQIHINHKSRRISLSFPPNPTNFPFCVWVVYHFILHKMGVVNYEFWVFFTSHGLFYCRKTGRGFRDKVRHTRYYIWRLLGRPDMFSIFENCWWCIYPMSDNPSECFWSLDFLIRPYYVHCDSGSAVSENLWIGCVKRRLWGRVLWLDKAGRDI